MDKDELLKNLQEQLAAGTLSRAEVELLINVNSPGPEVDTSRLHLSNVLYYVGGAIAVLGISVLIWQNWRDFGEAMHIFLTLGLGILTYTAGVLLSREPRLRGISTAFYFMAAVLLPLGVGVSFDAANIRPTYGMQSLAAAMLMIMFLAAYSYSRLSLLSALSIVFGSWLYFALTSASVEAYSPLYESEKFTAYRVAVLGLAYVLLGRYFDLGRRRLAGWLYLAGLMMFYGSAFGLSIRYTSGHEVWNILLPIFITLGLWLSVRWQSKVFLGLSALALIGYAGKLTAEYFLNSLGWPVVLVVIGLIIVGVGYLSISFGKKYISKLPNA